MTTKSTCLKHDVTNSYHVRSVSFDSGALLFSLRTSVRRALSSSLWQEISIYTSCWNMTFENSFCTSNPLEWQSLCSALQIINIIIGDSGTDENLQLSLCFLVLVDHEVDLIFLDYSQLFSLFIKITLPIRSFFLGDLSTTMHYFTFRSFSRRFWCFRHLLLPFLCSPLPLRTVLHCLLLLSDSCSEATGTVFTLLG